MAKTTDKLHPEENTESVATGQQTNNASQTHSKHTQINKKPKQQAKNTETNTVKTTDWHQLMTLGSVLTITENGLHS